MATLKYLSQYFSTTLNVGGGIDASQTTGIILQSVSGVHDITEPGQICVTYSDPIDTSVAEWIDYTSINGSNELVGAVRGREGFSAHTHLQGATVAFVLSASHHNDVVDLLNGTEAGIKVKTAIYDENGNEVIKTPATTDAVNEVTVTNSATGNAVQLSATGGDTNIDLKLVPKGTGALLDKNGDALAPNHSMSRQAIINGNFDVWQRGTTATNPANNTYLTADRWVNEFSLGGATFPTNIIHSRQILTSGDITNSFYHYRIAPDGAGTSWGVNTFYMTEQRIEHGTRLLCGASKKVTVSFYARSSITNKRLGIGLSQGYGTGGSPTTEEQIAGTVKTLTSSWVKYTHTFTTNTLASKTFGTANDDYLQLSIGVAWGSTFGNARFSSADTETFVGSGTIDIAQVQLCAGDVALPFQPKSFEEELRACMRYCQSRSVAGYEGLGQGNAGSTTVAYIQIPFYTEMRISPALTATAADWRLFDSAGTGFDLTVIALDSGTKSKYIGAITATVASGLTQWRPYLFGGDNGGTRVMIFDAEL